MSEGQPRIGFVGVGAMGQPMARNLLRADFPLVFCTGRDTAAAALVAEGGTRLADPQAVGSACDVLLVCLPADAEIVIDDLAGDGDHYRARIVSKAFAGLPRVRQHQLVYAALKGKMGGELHALALETTAPAGD